MSGGGSSGAVTVSLDYKAATTLTLNAQTGTTYTTVAADASAKFVTLTNASAITVTVAAGLYSVGEQINFAQMGAGQVTFQGDTGVTIVSTGATAATPKLRAQYSTATAICTASNTWIVVFKASAYRTYADTAPSSVGYARGARKDRGVDRDFWLILFNFITWQRKERFYTLRTFIACISFINQVTNHSCTFPFLYLFIIISLFI